MLPIRALVTTAVSLAVITQTIGCDARGITPIETKDGVGPPSFDQVQYATGTFVSGEQWEESAGTTEPPHACPPTLHRTSAKFWFNINNVGNTQFTAYGPFQRMEILSSNTAWYSMSGGVAQSVNSDWMAEGKILVHCHKFFAGAFWAHVGHIINFEGTVWRTITDCPPGSEPVENGCEQVEQYTGGGTPPGEEEPMEWEEGCIWYEYTYWEYWDGEWQAQYSWYDCE